MTKPDNDRRLQTEDLLVTPDPDPATTGAARTPSDDADAPARDEVYRDGEDVRGTDARHDTASGDSPYRDTAYTESGYHDSGVDRTDPPTTLTGSEHADSDLHDRERTDQDLDRDLDGDRDGAVEADHDPEYTENAPTQAIPEQQAVRESGVPVATDAEEPGAQLFTDTEVERFRGQWQAIQTTFVDDPRDAVRGADHLVAEVMQALAATFTEHKRGLEEQWQHGEEAQTEDLRQALRRYRSFFNQLLHT
ncbi:hypothetical protein [Actinokineospora diospyrosa]|uniref:Uncharacterized protein n=1 Tax=Actinokineospora diospyrosa TaxID=103728 RepID=A0ABT1IA84_9PSEU|nr:hypothetical protein [Actinokineospora diospyrosa]MCP2269540.1 hypothetical protein [Actinokineospora diospyrosa]